MTPEPVPPPGEPGGGAGLPTNRKAVYSVMFGAAAFACIFFSDFFAFALSVPALTTGIHGRREIATSHGAEGGDMVAIIGLTTAATTLGLLAISFVISSLLPS